MKVAPLLHELRRREQTAISPKLIHTGQHYDEAMSDIFFEQLDIPRPDVSLGVGSGSHGRQTGGVLIAFEEYLLAREEKPRGVVVVGDVNSTVACSLAAVKLGIPVAHVEAGLRSFDRQMPEEINRVITDAIADICLVTEESALENLRREGVAAERIHLVGNVMIDTLFAQLSRARELDIVPRLRLQPKRFGLVTLHRPSNVDETKQLRRLIEGLIGIAGSFDLVFPVHPRTRKQLRESGLDEMLGRTPAIRLLDPVGYHENVALMSEAAFVITDSGGIQEETSAMGIPCLTMRANTERPVTVTKGTNTLVGDDIELTARLIDEIAAGNYKSGEPIPLWDGHAAARVIDVLENVWMSQPSDERVSSDENLSVSPTHGAR